jgi:hypothetical protein
VAHTRDTTHLCRINGDVLEILHGCPLIIVAVDPTLGNSAHTEWGRTHFRKNQPAAVRRALTAA